MYLLVLLLSFLFPVPEERTRSTPPAAPEAVVCPYAYAEACAIWVADGDDGGDPRPLSGKSSDK